MPSVKPNPSFPTCSLASGEISASSAGSTLTTGWSTGVAARAAPTATLAAKAAASGNENPAMPISLASAAFDRRCKGQRSGSKCRFQGRRPGTSGETYPRPRRFAVHPRLARFT
jgi:hypothetical protein